MPILLGNGKMKCPACDMIMNMKNIYNDTGVSSTEWQQGFMDGINRAQDDIKDLIGGVKWLLFHYPITTRLSQFPNATYQSYIRPKEFIINTCPECGEERTGDDRVKNGMKCRFCAYGGEDG